MATFNTSHHQMGGVLLFSGELILLFCDNVILTLSQTSQEDIIGRLYLTTHRMIFTNKYIKSSLKSFSAPFYSMHDLKLKRPIFGYYIKGQVNDAQTNNAVVFKLRFNNGGAIEYCQVLQSAARVTQKNAAKGTFEPPPPPYTASASQYYHAPLNVYQPAYNCGFVLPTNIFIQPPPTGFVYTLDQQAPYPGIGPTPTH